MPYNEIEAEFQHHMIRHGRNYGTKEEYYYRLGLFTAMYHKIKTHNEKFAEEMGFEMGFNRFSDMTEEEFKRHTGFIPVRDYPAEMEDGIEEDVPAVNGGVNWVD